MPQIQAPRLRVAAPSRLPVRRVYAGIVEFFVRTVGGRGSDPLLQLTVDVRSDSLDMCSVMTLPALTPEQALELAQALIDSANAAVPKAAGSGG